MSDVSLIAGPYRAHKSWKPGSTLIPVTGPPLKIEGLTKAPIPWPYVKGPADHKSLVLGGDLAVAVTKESLAAVAYHWSVSRATVTRWRRALGVDRWTEGTRALYSRQWDIRLGPDASKAGGLATKGIPKKRVRI